VISRLNSGHLLGRARSLFSERPIYLRSSGLCGFGTVLEIPTFRRAYEFPRKEVLRLLSDRREHPIPIRHIEVRILPPQPAIRALGQAPRGSREWAENPSFLSIRFRLQTPGSPIFRWKSPKVSGLVREYSRFAETIGGDRFDHDCRPTAEVPIIVCLQNGAASPLRTRLGRVFAE
jgi:hypothetical protein